MLRAAADQSHAVSKYAIRIWTQSSSDSRIMFPPKSLLVSPTVTVLLPKFVVVRREGAKRRDKKMKDGENEKRGGKIEAERISDGDLVTINVIRVTFKFVRSRKAEACCKNEYCQSWDILA